MKRAVFWIGIGILVCLWYSIELHAFTRFQGKGLWVWIYAAGWLLFVMVGMYSICFSYSRTFGIYALLGALGSGALFALSVPLQGYVLHALIGSRRFIPDGILRPFVHAVGRTRPAHVAAANAALGLSLGFYLAFQLTKRRG